jgi:predicted transcriptional regulator
MAENQGQIDKEVLDKINEEKVLKSYQTQEEFNRTELNFYCEFYSLLKKLNSQLDGLLNAITTLGSDKISAFFKEISANVEKEQNRQEVLKKVKKSHLPKKKSCK